MAETRVYAVFRAQTTTAPTDAIWRNVGVNMIQQSGTLARAIWLYGNLRDTPAHRISFDKMSLNAAQLRRYRMFSFEIDEADRDEAIDLINSIAATRSITGTVIQKTAGILQAEIREAAVREGFSGAQANQITCAVRAMNGRDGSILAVQEYLAANAAIWYE